MQRWSSEVNGVTVPASAFQQLWSTFIIEMKTVQRLLLYDKLSSCHLKDALFASLCSSVCSI